MSIDAGILRALREAAGVGVSGADLAEQFGVTRSAVWARIQDLRKLGYEIDANPHSGYALRRSPDLLLADDVIARLGPGGTIGRDVRVFKQTTSTNDVVEKLARDGVEEGVVVLAESQTQGRGRLGRRWVSPAGKGIWMSVLLRPELRPGELTQLTVGAAVALRRSVNRVCGVQAEIKWPNDLLLGGRKVAGILVEMHAEMDQVRSAVVGIGVDANLEWNDLPQELQGEATSLRMWLGRPVDRGELAAAIIEELDQVYGAIRGGQFADLAEEWEAACTTLGQLVMIRSGSRQLDGRAESLDECGTLMIRMSNGRLERVTGGDVTLAG